ncbi:MAG: FapA family protein [Spirochaetaceae bacterium]|nr:FapA family protein [Spirochaetaceae bacterium]
MVDFADLQAAVKERLEIDSAVTVVETEGPTLEDAISEAAALLGVPLRHIEYEIIERRTSVFGIGENICKVRAYQRSGIKVEDEKIDEYDVEEYFEEASLLEEDIDGQVFVQCRRDGVYLKITSPTGNGESAKKSTALHLLNKRGITSFDINLINSLFKLPETDYVRVADFQNITFNDSTVSVEISDQETKAFIKVTPPKTGGCDFSFEEYIEILKNNGVVHGVNEELLRSFADNPVYKEKICIATSTRPVDGLNSYLDYLFETDPGRVRLSEGTDGKVNFKELNIIQNVMKDQALARSYHAEKGRPGYTVTGKFLQAHDGKEFPVTLGKNVRFAEDGITILADINGQAVISNGKINVESVYTIDGSVGLKTGNILFLGNVIVTGNVEEGFSVKASGNIEVYGLADKSTLTAEGDIIVRQGIAGKKDESVNAGRSIWAKFIENATVSAGSMVVVSDGILNSKIDAGKCIICQGKRAAIIGGHLRAVEEISAKSLGSPSGNTETICEVGTDPKKKSQRELLEVKKSELINELDNINLNIKTLNNIKQQRQALPEDKEAYLRELMENSVKINEELKNVGDRIEEINIFLQNLPSLGRVSASAKIHSGVVIVIRDVKRAINSDYKASTFILENGLIRAVAYIETDADLQQKAAK